MTTAALTTAKITRRVRWLPMSVFAAVFALHALYIRHLAALPAPGWENTGIVDTRYFGFRSYLQAQDYFVSFSYALGAAFAIWAVSEFLRKRRAALAAGAVGSVTMVGILMASGCFFLGCCGSPMLGVYLSIFGAKALGVGKPLMALVTLLSTGFGYIYLTSRKGWKICTDTSCKGSECLPHS